MTYEYLKITTNKDSEWLKVTEAGQEGWEMVAVRYDAGTVIYYFKREIQRQI